MFYSRIVALSKERGTNISNVISELQLSSGNLSKWKAGGMPKADTISKLADYFHVSTDYLLGRTDDPRFMGEAEEPSPLRSTLLHNFDQLNQEGQEKLVDTSDDMVTSGKYIKMWLSLLLSQKSLTIRGA